MNKKTEWQAVRGQLTQQVRTPGHLLSKQACPKPCSRCSGRYSSTPAVGLSNPTRTDGGNLSHQRLTPRGQHSGGSLQPCAQEFGPKRGFLSQTPKITRTPVREKNARQRQDAIPSGCTLHPCQTVSHIALPPTTAESDILPNVIDGLHVALKLTKASFQQPGQDDQAPS